MKKQQPITNLVLENLVQKHVNGTLGPDSMYFLTEKMDVLIEHIPAQFFKEFCLFPDKVNGEFNKWFLNNFEKILPDEYNLYLEKKQDRILREKIEMEEQKEFEAEQEDLLKDIPEEFKSWIRSEAWSRGHSDGYHEVLAIVRDHAYELLLIVEKYTKRILSENK